MISVESVKNVNISCSNGWRILFNTITTLNPSDVSMLVDLDHGDAWKFFFKCDLALFEKDDQSKQIDIGWEPEFSPEGAYLLEIFHNPSTNVNVQYDWEGPVHTFSTHSLTDLIDHLIYCFESF
jgi:hypothetical protein